MSRKPLAKRIIAENRKARRNYEIFETLEAGIQLQGTEIKSLREGRGNIADSYASPENGELFLINSLISQYSKGNRFNHEERRRRKLLLHKREINKFSISVQRGGMTIVPLELYIDSRGFVKVKLALARGRTLFDKREVEKTRDWNRQKARLLRDRG